MLVRIELHDGAVNFELPLEAGAALGVHCIVEHLELQERAAPHGARERADLDREAQLIDLFDLARAELAHEHAAPRQLNEEPALDQHADGFADGCAAHVHLTRERSLDDLLAGLQLACENGFIEPCDDLVGQALRP